MGQYNFVSPSGMAGDALVETLTKQREEARRQMLADLEVTQEKRAQQATDAQIAEAQARTRREDTEANMKGEIDMQRITDMHNQDRDVAEITKIINDPNSTQQQIVSAMMRASSKGVTIPAGLQSILDKKKRIIYDPNTGKQIDVGNDVDMSVVPWKPAPRVPPREPTPQFIGTDKAGLPVFSDNAGTFTRGEKGERQGFFGPIGSKPSAASAKMPAPFNDATTKDLAKLRSEGTDGKGWLGRSASTLQKQAYRNAVINFASMAKTTDPSINQAVYAIISSMGTPNEDARTAQEVADELSGNPDTTPQEAWQVERLLLALRGY